MPNLGKGTKCIRLLLLQALKDMHEPQFPMFLPILCAHISGAEFQYPVANSDFAGGKVGLSSGETSTFLRGNSGFTLVDTATSICQKSVAAAESF